MLSKVESILNFKQRFQVPIRISGKKKFFTLVQSVSEAIVMYPCDGL